MALFRHIDVYLFRIPFMRHTPYLSLDFGHFGWQCGPKPRQIFHWQICWGVMFTGRSNFICGEIQLPIRTLMFL